LDKFSWRLASEKNKTWFYNFINELFILCIEFEYMSFVSLCLVFMLIPKHLLIFYVKGFEIESLKKILLVELIGTHLSLPQIVYIFI
jgi:hypothetical protein